MWPRNWLKRKALPKRARPRQQSQRFLHSLSQWLTEKTPVVSDPALKKKELIEIVTERSGIKKKDAKPVIEAMLAVLGQTLAEGREMNLQPLGKVRINRAKDVQGGKVLITKIRQSNRVPKPSADPAAKAAE